MGYPATYEATYSSQGGQISLLDYEFMFGNGGFVLNTDFNGTLPFIDVTQVTGLDSAPKRMNTNEHEGMDGTYVDGKFQSMRTVVITGTLFANVNDCDTILKQLRADYTDPTIRPFYFQLPSQGIQFVNAQGGGCQYDIDTLRRLGQTSIQFTLLCSDPNIYDYPASFGRAAYNVVPDIGFGFPIGFPLAFGGPIFYSSVAVANYGTKDAYPTFLLYGALQNPSLSSSVSDSAMTFKINLQQGDTLQVDCQYKRVILNDSESRRSALKGLTFFTVPKNETVMFFLSADSGAGSFSVTSYNTYY